MRNTHLRSSILPCVHYGRLVLAIECGASEVYYLNLEGAGCLDLLLLAVLHHCHVCHIVTVLEQNVL